MPGLSASSDISQGSVATHLRIGGIFSDSFITNCLLILTVKNFENWLIFAEIIRCTKNGAILAPSVDNSHRLKDELWSQLELN